MLIFWLFPLMKPSSASSILYLTPARRGYTSQTLPVSESGVQGSLEEGFLVFLLLYLADSTR